MAREDVCVKEVLYGVRGVMGCSNTPNKGQQYNSIQCYHFIGLLYPARNESIFSTKL